MTTLPLPKRTGFPRVNAPNSSTAGADEHVDVSLLHTTLLTPSSVRSAASSVPHVLYSPEVLAATHQRIAQYDAAAANLRAEADKLSGRVQRNAESFAQVVARWRELMHQPTRTSREAAEFARLEHEIPALSQHIAGLRGRWTACVAAARDQEEAAEHLRAQLPAPR